MFAGAVVVKSVWFFATRTKFGCSFGAVRLVHAAFQRLRAETYFLQHRRGNLGVDWFAVVRRAGECYFTIGEAESIGCAGQQQWQCLERFCGRSGKDDVVRSTERGNDVSPGLDSNDMSAMA